MVPSSDSLPEVEGEAQHDSMVHVVVAVDEIVVTAGLEVLPPPHLVVQVRVHEVVDRIPHAGPGAVSEHVLGVRRAIPLVVPGDPGGE